MRHKWINFVLGLAVGAFFVWLTVRQVDTEQLVTHLSSIDYIYGIPPAILWIGICFLRSWRWRFLLNPLARIGYWRVMAVHSVANMAVVLMPFRLGELARPYLISDRGNIGMSAAMATVVVERAIDGIFVCLCFFLTLPFLAGPTLPREVIYAAYVALTIFAGALAVVCLAVWKREPTIAAVEALCGKVSPRLARWLADILRSFTEGVASLRRGGTLGAFFALTIAYWALNIHALYLMFRPFSIDLSWAAAVILTVVVVFCIAIPAAPGFIGNWHFAVVVSFLAFGLTREQGLSFAIIVHVVQLGLVILVGLIFLSTGQVSLIRLRAATSMDEELTK